MAISDAACIGVTGQEAAVKKGTDALTSRSLLAKAARQRGESVLETREDRIARARQRLADALRNWVRTMDGARAPPHHAPGKRR